MFGIGGTEIFIIIALVLILFGPDKLPAMGRTIGKFIREFKRAQDTMESVIRAEMHSDKRPASAKTSWSVAADEDEESEEEEESEEPARSVSRPGGSASGIEDEEPEDEEEEE